jgi:HPt (histidine-containing phosphotransfer) domain-containing protein
MKRDKIDELPGPLKEYIPTYFEHRRAELPELLDALGKDDFQSIRAVCHRIIGSAASYKLYRLEEIAKELQKEAKAKNSEACKKHLSMLNDYLMNY